jgi:hypothetical protein
MSASGMTSDAKKALSRTVRGLRERLLDELHEATEGAYRLSLPFEKADIDEAARVKRARLERWIGEQTRGLPKPAQKSATERFRLEIEKDAAATWLLRLVYLRLLEAAGLRQVNLVTGGWGSAAYKEFREHAPELVQNDASEGYATLLELVWSELALELPGVFGDVRLTSLVPMPPRALRAIVDALNDDALESVWEDDTTLGWVYQYWNDPEREALDKKLNESQKLENHEIASKTQMFTERYMVEWLLHNSLGTMWLAMCRKHGWTADVERKGEDGLSTLERLDVRRAEWRKRREASEVPLDALMPIAPGLEARWKYWVPQPIPDDAVAKAPASVREIKLLDPACGSGHFLVIACDLLFALYEEEAQHLGGLDDPELCDTERTDNHRLIERYSGARIVESVIEHNLHGIDIDPRAVQIAAAALILKCKQLAPNAEPRAMNLVAPNLSLAALPADDPARPELYEQVERETGLPRALTARVLQALEGADHLGTLLKIDAAIDAALREWEEKLVRRNPEQGRLFGEEQFGAPQLEMVSLTEARETLIERLEQFLSRHSRHEDLGLRLKGEQLAAGVRFMRMVREDQYDLLIGNPPYQGTSKMADAEYVQKHYPRGKSDLYAAFMERGLQLAKDGGVLAMVTMRNWMFIQQYAELRKWLLASYDLRVLGDVDRGAFEEVPNEVLAAVLSVFRCAQRVESPIVAIQPTPLDNKSYDRERTRRKRAAVLCQARRFEFDINRVRAIPGSPVVYWWSNSEITQFCSLPLLGSTFPARKGIDTGDNVRFVRFAWELAPDSNGYVPFVQGGKSRKWLEPHIYSVNWARSGTEIKVLAAISSGANIRNEGFFFRVGVAFSLIGAEFSARVHRVPSVIGGKGSSVYPDDVARIVCLLNSGFARAVMASLNPGIGFEIGDLNRLPVVEIQQSASIWEQVLESFSTHESHRESSVEFRQPGPSPWRYSQDWAQRAIDRPQGELLPPHEPAHDPEPSTDYLSFALGVALGRFGANGEGILDAPPAITLPHGILYLSAVSDRDSLAHPACAPVLKAWARHGQAIDPKRALKNYLQDEFFPKVHKRMYESRPIYFPLSSAKKSFVAYVSIHRWTETTMRALLADHLYPDKQTLEGQLHDVRVARQSADKKTARDAERRFDQVGKWLDELTAFIKDVEQCAEKGPPLPPNDAKCPARERDARYVPDLDDGVMINAAALWPLLEPQWKDPQKWWKELARAEGKKDYDWSHLAARYFRDRVDDKCKKDPSLAVAHGCFWKYHPEKAYQWELRLQDEIAADFKLEEPGSDEARAGCEQAHPDKVQAVLVAEQKRRERKRRKSGNEGDAQGDLELDGDDSPSSEADEASEANA